MVRRGCDADARLQNEPPKKKSKTAPECNADEKSSADDGELPCGLILKDVKQNRWKIGQSIGRGSFGRIYLASNILSREANVDNAKYVVKIEPHDNGPLFVELNCLVRNCRTNLIRKWRELKKLSSIGVPQYICHGSHHINDTRYRFLVLPRYDRDLQTIIRENDNVLDLRSVLVLAYQILHVLEYIHARGYTHCDIKSSNLVIGFDGASLERNEIRPIKRIENLKSIKHNRNKIKHNNYYDDEDFDIDDYESSSTDDEPSHKSFRKMLKDPKVRKLHRNHAFNLRQLQTSINYEDIDSSICSDLSYQNVPKIDKCNMVDEGFHEENSKSCSENSEDCDVYTEAMLAQNKHQIYLLDYGLASKFLDSDGVHKEFGMDQRKAHDGTLKYSSLDSHIGAHSRRSDLESLGYNLLDWLSGNLPWKNQEMLNEPDLVHALKKNYMKDIKQLLMVCFKSETPPEFLEKYFTYVTTLEFVQKPDYKFCRDLFKSEFIKHQFGSEKDMILNFDKDSTVKKNYSKKLGRTKSDFLLGRSNAKKACGRENKTLSIGNDLKLELLKKTLNLPQDILRKPCTLRNFFISDADLVAKLKQTLLPTLETPSKKFSPKKLRSQKTPIRKRKGKKGKRSNIGKFGNFLGSGKQFTWAEILAGNPEEILRNQKKSEDDEKDNCNSKSRNRKASNASETCPDNPQSVLLQKNYLNGLNPTYAMKEVHMNFKRKMTGKRHDTTEEDPYYDGFTPAMITILKSIKSKKIQSEETEDDDPEQTEIYYKIPTKREVICRSRRAIKNPSESLDAPGDGKKSESKTPQKRLTKTSKETDKSSRTVKDKCIRETKDLKKTENPSTRCLKNTRSRCAPSAEKKKSNLRSSSSTASNKKEPSPSPTKTRRKSPGGMLTRTSNTARSTRSGLKYSISL